MFTVFDPTGGLWTFPDKADYATPHGIVIYLWELNRKSLFTLYTVREAAEQFFQGKVSCREVNKLFNAGKLFGYRVEAKILIYAGSLQAYRQSHENCQPPSRTLDVEDEAPILTPTPVKPRAGRQELPPVRLKKLPKE